MHDTIANIAGWLFIIWRKPFQTGDRIQIGEVSGDVIDSFDPYPTDKNDHEDCGDI